MIATTAEAEPLPAPRTHRARWTAVAVGVVVALFVGLLATRPPARNTVAASPLVGRPAPELSGTGLDGTTVRVSQFRGRYVAVNFFATWCVPCRREHPELVTFGQRHEAAGDAQIVAVIWDDDPAAVRRFFEVEGGGWPVLTDPGGRIALDLGARGPPETFVIDPTGVVIARFVGEVSADGLDRVLRRDEERRRANPVAPEPPPEGGS